MTPNCLERLFAVMRRDLILIFFPSLDSASWPAAELFAKVRLKADETNHSA